MNTPVTSGPLDSFSHFLKESLGDWLAPSAHTFLEMLAEEAIMEFPYTPPGGVPRLEGRNAIAQYLVGVGDMLRIDEITLLASYRMPNSGTVILEFSCTGSGVKTGEPYNQNYISVITLKEGAITHYRDYWNPLIALEAIGGNEAIEAALQGAVN